LRRCGRKHSHKQRRLLPASATLYSHGFSAAAAQINSIFSLSYGTSKQQPFQPSPSLYVYPYLRLLRTRSHTHTLTTKPRIAGEMAAPVRISLASLTVASLPADVRACLEQGNAHQPLPNQTGPNAAQRRQIDAIQALAALDMYQPQPAYIITPPMTMPATSRRR
jgi:hypothetical protein